MIVQQVSGRSLFLISTLLWKFSNWTDNFMDTSDILKLLEIKLNIKYKNTGLIKNT